MNRQVSVSHQQALEKRFSSHSFILSPVGILKIFVIILFLVGSIISLSAEVCSKYGQWLELTFPIVTVVNGVLIALLYVVFILGLAKGVSGIWIKIDLVISTVTAILSLVLSILVLANCSNDGAITIVPGIFGVVGSLLLFISAATLFVTWQNTGDDVVEAPVPREPFDLKRKSVAI
ncbi:uncharacterized protein LOC143915204 [Arctopsyche grandis]|uniref:uncharacterized protein LOC143915204 n=1 Tax=Arctopsyche grandis TaxID=121162 RepID=UPI00406D96EF